MGLLITVQNYRGNRIPTRFPYIEITTTRGKQINELNLFQNPIVFFVLLLTKFHQRTTDVNIIGHNGAKVFITETVARRRSIIREPLSLDNNLNHITRTRAHKPGGWWW